MPRLSANTTHRKAFANSGAGEAIADMLVMAHDSCRACLSVTPLTVHDSCTACLLLHVACKLGEGARTARLVWGRTCEGRRGCWRLEVRGWHQLTVLDLSG